MTFNNKCKQWQQLNSRKINLFKATIVFRSQLKVINMTKMHFVSCVKLYIYSTI